MTSFPTAPAWYRPVLYLDKSFFTLAFAPARYRARRTGLARREGGPMNLRLGPITGRLAGERMLPGEVPQWMFDIHAARYEWAAERARGRVAVDLGCGVGYGSEILTEAAREVIGVDASPDAIEVARRRAPNVTFIEADLTSAIELPDGDVGVCFEVLEHLSDPQSVISAALTKYERVLFSMPNPLLSGSHLNPHHVQDWPLSKCKREMRRGGARQLDVFSQARKRPEIRAGGRPWMMTWVFDCRADLRPNHRR